MELSICIPTYNRMNQLKKTLDNLFEILKNISKWEDKIEIVVSDNNSTDKTREICNNYVGKIKYYRNEENLGYDKNILSLYTKAKGDYVFFLSDDDNLLKKGFIEVFDFIVKSEKKYDCIFCNYVTQISNDKEINAFESLQSFDKELNIYELRNKLPFIFLSSFILKRKVLSDFDFLEETFATQMEIALKILFPNSKAYIFMNYVVERIAPELMDETGCNIPENAWKVFLGFAKVKRKYEAKHELNNSIYMEIDSLNEYFSFFLFRKNKNIFTKIKVYFDVTEKFRKQYGLKLKLLLDLRILKNVFIRGARKILKVFLIRRVSKA